MEAEETEEEEAVYFIQFCLTWLTLHICENWLRAKNIEAVWCWGQPCEFINSGTRPKPLVHLSELVSSSTALIKTGNGDFHT